MNGKWKLIWNACTWCTVCFNYTVSRHTKLCTNYYYHIIMCCYSKDITSELIVKMVVEWLVLSPHSNNHPGQTPDRSWHVLLIVKRRHILQLKLLSSHIHLFKVHSAFTCQACSCITIFTSTHSLQYIRWTWAVMCLYVPWLLTLSYGLWMEWSLSPFDLTHQ